MPTVSEWGLVVMTLLVLSAGTLVCMKRRWLTG
ncbi:MAG: IPTL-CTERM sorting domain-containing protein [Planctomycetota bacterium]